MAVSARKRTARREDLGLTRAEFAILRRLDTPQKIQLFVNAIPANHEIGGETILSVRQVLRQRRARFSARPRAVPPRAALGRNFQAQRRAAALSRPGLPQPARARDVVLPRI